MLFGQINVGCLLIDILGSDALFVLLVVIVFEITIRSVLRVFYYFRDI